MRRQGSAYAMSCAPSMPADGEDDVLLAVEQVRHRRPGLFVRHFDGAEIRAGRLVVGASSATRAPGVVAVHAAFAGDDERLRRERADERAARLTETRRERHALQGRIAPDVIRRRAVRLLPEDLARLHVVRSDAIVRRFDEGQSLHRRTAAGPRRVRTGATWTCATARRRWGIGSAAGVGAPPRAPTRRASGTGLDRRRSRSRRSQSSRARCRRDTRRCASECRGDSSPDRMTRPASSRRRYRRGVESSRGAIDFAE
jgi:hypothetical protein